MMTVAVGLEVTSKCNPPRTRRHVRRNGEAMLYQQETTALGLKKLVNEVKEGLATGRVVFEDVANGRGAPYGVLTITDEADKENVPPTNGRSIMMLGDVELAKMYDSLRHSGRMYRLPDDCWAQCAALDAAEAAERAKR